MAATDDPRGTAKAREISDPYELGYPALRAIADGCGGYLHESSRDGDALIAVHEDQEYRFTGRAALGFVQAITHSLRDKLEEVSARETAAREAGRAEALAAVEKAALSDDDVTGNGAWWRCRACEVQAPDYAVRLGFPHEEDCCVAAARRELEG